jgi:ferrochelatase
MEDVMPYLDNVLRGKSVPQERKLEVAHHYKLFQGKSPINDQNRAVIAALDKELREHGLDLPIYFGNRNWHPLLTDTVQRMKQDGIRRALAFVTSAFSCYSGCRQYREDVADACSRVGEGAPRIDKIRVFHNHPRFIDATTSRVRSAWETIPADHRATSCILFSAHSIPLSMAEGSRYEAQLQEVSRLVAESVRPPAWELVYQSRSGPPHQPWLEPDVCETLRTLRGRGIECVVLAPIGFVSDHVEVLFDLDVEARATCEDVGLSMIRSQTVGDHPTYVRMIRELIEERLDPSREAPSAGRLGPNPPVCPAGCCAYNPRRPIRPASTTSTSR